jgi:hypothetical protein
MSCAAACGAQPTYGISLRRRPPVVARSALSSDRPPSPPARVRQASTSLANRCASSRALHCAPLLAPRTVSEHVAEASQDTFPGKAAGAPLASPLHDRGCESSNGMAAVRACTGLSRSSLASRQSDGRCPGVGRRRSASHILMGCKASAPVVPKRQTDKSLP